MSDERLSNLEDAVRVLAENSLAKSGQSGELDSLAVQYAVEDEDEAEPVADVNATEAAVVLAAAEGIDLSDVQGSGEDGRILVSDVEDIADGA